MNWPDLIAEFLLLVAAIKAGRVWTRRLEQQEIERTKQQETPK